MTLFLGPKTVCADKTPESSELILHVKIDVQLLFILYLLPENYLAMYLLPENYLAISRVFFETEGGSLVYVELERSMFIRG